MMQQGSCRSPTTPCSVSRRQVAVEVLCLQLGKNHSFGSMARDLGFRVYDSGSSSTSSRGFRVWGSKHGVFVDLRTLENVSLCRGGSVVRLVDDRITPLEAQEQSRGKSRKQSSGKIMNLAPYIGLYMEGVKIL